MNRFIILLLLICVALGETRKWDAHSAYLIPPKQWELGLFQPFRYGYRDGAELSTHPLWFFVLPNLSIKKSHSSRNGFARAMQYDFVYPTPFLNMVAKKGIMGIISPEFQMPPMVGLSATGLMSKDLAGINTTLKGGVDLGLVFGDLDKRSTIDFPMVYHRLGVYYNGYGFHVGLDAQKFLTPNINLIGDIDYRLLPGLDGDYSIEHKALVAWHKSDNFRVMTGYKFVVGAYPFGTQANLLPYIPMMEKWIPVIEFQWSGKKS